jgi:protein SCO1/2
VSINPNETPQLAAQKRANTIESYHRGQDTPDRGWHFLTGKEDQIQALASQVGFKYRYDESEKQYIHAAALFVLTPEGKISRYLYGISFQPKDLRFSLAEASHGKIGSVMDQVLLFCFHFDPDKNSYTFQVWKAVQMILMVQVLVLGVCLYVLWKKERKNPSPNP